MHPSLGLLLIRLGLAAVFIWHGWAKLSNMEGTIAFFGMLGFASFFAYLVAIVELVGGILMLFGLWTWAAGIALAIIMAVAVLKVKWAKGFFGGYEYELILLLASLGMALIGPGKYAVMRGGCEGTCPCDKDGKCGSCK